MLNLLNNPANRNKIVVFAGDIILITVLAFAVAALRDLFATYHVPRVFAQPLKVRAIGASFVICVFTLYILGLYDMDKMGEKSGRPAIVARLVLTGFFSMLLTFTFSKILIINKTTAAYLFLCYSACIAVLYGWRVFFRKVFLKSGHFSKRVLFVGRDELTGEILEGIKGSGYIVAGSLSGNGEGGKFCDPGSRILGTIEELDTLADNRRMDVVVFSRNTKILSGTLKNIQKYRQNGIELYKSAVFYENLTRKTAIKHFMLEEGSVLPHIPLHSNRVFCKTKRLMDFFGALFIFIVLLPVFAFIAVLIKITSKGPVFYFQKRLGLYEKPFTLIKFRTMFTGAEDKNGPQWSIKGDPRITAIGRILRRGRLDELPQLINIIKGELSFVGPRPIRQYFAETIEKRVPFYSMRFNIKPGISGWAQVHYDYGGSVEGHIEKFQYDLYYIKHASLFLDLFVILKTFQTLACRPADR